MLSILRKARLKDKEMRILMLGLDNAGKTTIVKKVMGEDVNTVSPTLGFIIKTIDYEGYKLNIWDVGGQKTLRSYWRNYFEKTDALIWVVDATDRLRIQDCRDELQGLLLEERLAGASLLVFANKTDVEGCMTEEEILSVCPRYAMTCHVNMTKLTIMFRSYNWNPYGHIDGTSCHAAL
ncbi:ADP-ribosylation factor-like 2 [Fusarium subglutinans]|uniref:ADP-ribosylation factor-like 2 n=1 Tax=Gibberella subglutinans TaxID=42677 RepID=A0A8H5QG61_GIBSU|nr:ADP-ribosylation factor-like 2 [Fusarium subglutinans]KAF5613912.1 ADP-ribosylation factor-like 2 [Fusarium subglutinans]